MASFVQKLGLRLVDAGNKAFDASKLSPSDVVVLYFSAHWCPPCRTFTPMLKEFYNWLRSLGYSLQIIFVSADHSEMEMFRYMHEAHGNWLCVHYDDPNRESLSGRFGLQGIPAMAVLNEYGQSVVADPRSDVQNAFQSGDICETKMLEWMSKLNFSDVPFRLPAGAGVKVRGLQKAPELNGCEGIVGSYAYDKQRYFVDISGDTKSLRAANLLQLIKVTLPAEQDEAREAKVTDYDEATDELILQIGDSGEEASETLRCRFGAADSPILKAGARVTIDGIKADSAKRWNGRLGEVLSYDEEAKRYEVRVTPLLTLRVLPEKMRLCPL